MRSLPLVAFYVTACSVGFELPPSGARAAPNVTLEPFGSPDSAPAVFRFRVHGGAGRSPLSDYRLFSGELSAYHLGRVKNEDLPGTLLEREIPVLAWTESRDVMVAPLQTLPSGIHSLTTPELGLVAEVRVDEGPAPVLARAWPPPDARTGSGTAIFCGEATNVSAEGRFELAPSAAPASVARGLDEEGAFSKLCLRVEPDGAVRNGIPLLPPAFVGEVALEPRLLVVSEGNSESVECADAELALGPICGAVADDRVELRAPRAPAFVAFERPRVLVAVVRPERSLVLRGFEPASTTKMAGLVFDALGRRTRIDVDVTTAPNRPHVVLNEVLANPKGPEALGEWIELVNDGSSSVDLGDFVLDDAVEPVRLPARDLAPRAFALLVADGYAPDPELDVVAPPDVAVLALPKLGRNGLSNTGELLRLRDRNGDVVSRFPASSSPAPGRSVARRSPDAPDAEAGSFGPHAAPGASPGTANVVESE